MTKNNNITKGTKNVPSSEIKVLSASINETVDWFVPFVHEKISYKEAEKQKHANGFASAVLCCQESFKNGNFGAGVNLLGIVTLVLAHCTYNPDDLLPFKGKLTSCVSALEETGCMEGSYYLAYCLIHNLINTDGTPELNFEVGFALMQKLAELGNYLAVSFLEVLEETAEEMGLT